MKIIDSKSYKGRNIYSHKPVIKMTVDIEDLAEIPTVGMGSFNETLLDWFPGLKTHYCSTGHEGGFVERLQEGTYISHVTEHLALELQSVLGFDVYFGKTRLLHDSIYNIIYEAIEENIAIACGEAAVEIVGGLACNETVPINEIMERLYQTSGKSSLGPSTRAIMEEAKRRHIPVRRLGEDSLLQLGYGKAMRFVEASLADGTSCIAVDLAKNKQLSKLILQEQGIPVPDGGIADSEEAAVRLAEELGYPVVIKPFDGNQGKGVTTNINSEESLRSAYLLAKSYSNQIIIERQIKGNDYRILVVGNQVSAVAERNPPFVTGDGVHTIAELVEAENQNPDRGKGHEKPLTRIKFDTVTCDYLSLSGLSPDSIPSAGTCIVLRENSNLSTGGSARDCTMEIHPLNREIAVRAAKAIGLEIAGIDVVIEDISEPLTSSNGAVIEVNAAPGLRMHLFPSEGQYRLVAADIINHLYPAKTPASIPVISITGTNGKTTVARMIYHVLSLTGKKVGMTCSSGTFIGGQCVSKGDHSGPRSAHTILYNREVEAAVLETARGGMIRRGLGYDLADVGLVVNVSDDHLGLDGIETLEEMAYVKSLVTEAVKPRGYAVLNADDSMSEFIAKGVRCNLIYFSQNRGNPVILKHLHEGRRAVVAEEGNIIIYHGYRKIPLLHVNEVPITYQGRVICNIENTLAVTAGLMALEVPMQIIQSGLKSFLPDPVTNAGRFNLFNMGNYQIMLDYGHNPGGYRSVLQFIPTMNANRLVGIIGMPGDRPDEMIFQIGEMCGDTFSRLYIKEDINLRGRPSGEVAGILREGALHGGTGSDQIEMILSESEALEKAIADAMYGDLIVMFYEDFDQAYEYIKNHQGEQAEPEITAYEFIPLEEQPQTAVGLDFRYH